MMEKISQCFNVSHVIPFKRKAFDGASTDIQRSYESQP